MPNRFQPIQPGTDPNQQLAIINKNFGELDNESVKKLYYDSSGVPSIQIGVQSDGSSAIKVSKPGIDVTTATNAQLAFNSAQTAFKVAASGFINIPSITVTNPGAGNYGSNTVTTTVSHNLGYSPAIMAFSNSSGQYTPLPVYSASPIGTNTALWTNMTISVDTVNIYLTVTAMTVGAGTSVVSLANVKYYLLQESAS